MRIIVKYDLLQEGDRDDEIIMAVQLSSQVQALTSGIIFATWSSNSKTALRSWTP